VARTVLSNESAFIGGGNPRGVVFDRLRALADLFGRTDEPVVRQGLAEAYIREKVLSYLGERIMSAVRRREAPPVDPSILKLSVALNAVQAGDLAMELGGANVQAAEVDGGELARWAQATLLGRFSISIGGGTNEVQRNNLAERALGLPRERRDDHQIPWKDVLRS
jgi:acyl-CoA dehydrogenase